jgi:hypothetical protein
MVRVLSEIEINKAKHAFYGNYCLINIKKSIRHLMVSVYIKHGRPHGSLGYREGG